MPVVAAGRRSRRSICTTSTSTGASCASIGKGDKQRTVLINEAAADAMRGVSRPASAHERFGLSSWGVAERGSGFGRSGWSSRRSRSSAALPSTRHRTSCDIPSQRISLEHGADIMTIKELLGHESLATTQIYTNVSVEHMRKDLRCGASARSSRRSLKRAADGDAPLSAKAFVTLPSLHCSCCSPSGRPARLARAPAPRTPMARRSATCTTIRELAATRYPSPLSKDTNGALLESFLAEFERVAIPSPQVVFHHGRFSRA